MNNIRRTVSLTCRVPTYDQFSGMVGELLIKNPTYVVDSINFYHLSENFIDDRIVDGGYEGEVTLVNETPIVLT